MMPPLAVIPHFRRPDQLARCRAALAASTVPVDVFVHDNNGENIGFTAAVNRGLRVAVDERRPFAFVLNQDCYVRPDVVANLIAFMGTHPQCAIAGVKEVRESDPDFIAHGGCGRAYPSGQPIRGRKSLGDCAVSLPMPWVNGAAMFARTEAFVEFGLMDANMVLFGSDSDWCYTARARGWEVWYCAEAECIHEGGESRAHSSAEISAVSRRDMQFWHDKWVGSALFERLQALTPDERRSPTSPSPRADRPSPPPPPASPAPAP
jgi:GT2 family glycosyltransferase